jgi:hypothetical protein
MVGLSVRGDRPSIRLQPPLVDGIHLRWSCRRGLGFPRQYLRFTLPPGKLARWVEVRIEFRQAGAIHVTALSGDTPFWCQAEVPVMRSRVAGRAQEVISAVLEFDAIAAIELSAGPAALVDLCYVPVSREATWWTEMPRSCISSSSWR